MKKGASSWNSDHLAQVVAKNKLRRVKGNGPWQVMTNNEFLRRALHGKEFPVAGDSRKEALLMCLALHDWHDEQVETLKAAKFEKSVLAEVAPAVVHTVRTGRGPAMPVVIGGKQEHREFNPLF